MDTHIDRNAFAVANEERDRRVAEAEAAVVRTAWMPLGALLAVPVPFFGAIGGGPIVTRELSAAPKDPQDGEWYGFDRQARVVLARFFDPTGALSTEDVLKYELDRLTRVTYENRSMGTESSVRMEAQRLGAARPASLSPDVYEDFTPYGESRWRMAYDSGGRCEEIRCRSQAPDGTVYVESYRLRHDEQGLAQVVDLEADETVYSRPTRSASADVRDAVAAVVPLLVAALLPRPGGDSDDVPTLMFSGHAVPSVAWVPPGGPGDPTYFPDAVDPEEGFVLPAATVEVLRRTSQHIECDASQLRKYTTALRRELTKVPGLRGIRLAWDDLSPL